MPFDLLVGMVDQKTDQFRVVLVPVVFLEFVQSNGKIPLYSQSYLYLVPLSL